MILKMYFQREHSNFVNCVRFSPNGKKFISVGFDKKGVIFGGKIGEKMGELSKESGHTGSIYAVFTISADKSAKVWDINESGNGIVKKTITFMKKGGPEDMLMDLGSWLCCHIETKESAQINCLAAIERELVTCGFDNKMRRISLQEEKKNDEEPIVLRSQPKDLGVVVRCPELVLIPTDAGIILVQGLKIISTTYVGYAVTADALSPDGIEVVVDA